jgi:cellulose synthase/poly-beta-1,6-N-acetylglucosamine synthase-like glycosyltransferase
MKMADARTSRSPGIFFPGGFTVLMSAYAGDDIRLLHSAVESVYLNTLQPDDFILVIDGPIQDAMQEALQDLASRYPLRLLPLEKNVGLAGALNAALPEVKTDWVLRADADDFNVPERFAIQAAALHRNNGCLDLMGGAIREVERDGTVTAVRRTVDTHADLLRYVARRNPFNHMTVAFRTQCALRAGGYPSIHLKEDYALWAKLLATGARSMNVNDVLVHATAGRDMYRRRGGMKYALAEFALQKHLVHLGIISWPAACLQGALRATIFLLPSSIRGLIYERLLRVPA